VFRTPARRRRRVTLADVARYAGVSTAVVSYVVNEGPRPVAPETAERVRDAVEVLGYRPNSHARALSTGRTGILGLVVPETGNPFFGEYNDVLHQAASRAQVALLTASSAGHAETERHLIEDLAARNVDGIVVVTSMTRSDVPRLRDPGLPIIILNCPFAVPGYRTLGPDAVHGARRAVDHLLTVHDHPTVAYIAGETSAREPEDRELGWRAAHHDHRKPSGPLVRTTFTVDGGYTAARTLLSGPERPSAVLAASDLQAYGVMHAIRDAGLRIPDDIAVVSFDGTTLSAHTWPPLTVVRQPLHAMAEAALTQVLDGGPPLHTDFDMDLVIRSSCGCAPAGAPIA
jgi:LacI family transcriptional regulator